MPGSLKRKLIFQISRRCVASFAGGTIHFHPEISPKPRPAKHAPPLAPARLRAEEPSQEATGAMGEGVEVGGLAMEKAARGC